MNETKRLKDFAPVATIEEKKVSFREFIQFVITDGSELFDEDFQKIISESDAPNVWWGDVQDYFSPLVDEILVYSSQEDPEVYQELAQAVKMAYGKLKEKHESRLAEELEEFERDQLYELDRGSPDFFGKIDGLIHDLACKGRIIKDLDSSILGKYRIIVGKAVKEE